ncbi:MAG: hypothetical protein ACREFD_03830 [Stellaceae bacterium]
MLVVYLIMCFVIGIAGRRRRIGFFGFFLLSVILTPVVTLGWLLVTHRRFLAKEMSLGHVVMCADCAKAGAQEAIKPRHCVRCGTLV